MKLRTIETNRKHSIVSPRIKELCVLYAKGLLKEEEVFESIMKEKLVVSLNKDWKKSWIKN